MASYTISPCRLAIWQPPLLLFYDSAATEIERLLRKMCFDDALIRGWYRFEYLRLEAGLPHYRLYRRDALLGVVRLSSTNLGYRDRQVAMFLAGMGFNGANTRFVECGAKTPPDAKVADLPYLFANEGEGWRKRKMPPSKPVFNPAMMSG